MFLQHNHRHCSALLLLLQRQANSDGLDMRRPVMMAACRQPSLVIGLHKNLFSAHCLFRRWLLRWEPSKTQTSLLFFKSQKTFCLFLKLLQYLFLSNEQLALWIFNEHETGVSTSWPRRPAALEHPRDSNVHQALLTRDNGRFEIWNFKILSQKRLKWQISHEICDRVDIGTSAKCIAEWTRALKQKFAWTRGRIHFTLGTFC